MRIARRFNFNARFKVWEESVPKGRLRQPGSAVPSGVRQEKLGCSEGESPSRLKESVFRTKEMNGKV